jgi:hypothetical protein
MTSMPRGRPGEERGGFALALVVLMLFAIAVAGITGYQVVSGELTLATQNRDGQKALSVARAGLQRFLGETVGVVGDSVRYAIGDGIATVTTRKVLAKDSLNHLYYIHSVGTVADTRTPLSPATRAVGEYAWQRISPVPHKAAMLVSGGDLRLEYYARADGLDHDTSLDCLGGGTAGVAGVGTAGTAGTYFASYGASMTGNPPLDTSYPGFQAVYDTTGIRWDILTDPNFSVDFDGVPPSGIPSDSFPLVRYQGDLVAWSSWSGRGVLIVTGELQMWDGFEWDGIILAGALGQVYAWGSTDGPKIRGMVIGGLNGANPDVQIQSGTYDYHSCDAYAADKSLSYLEVVPNTLYEDNG